MLRTWRASTRRRRGEAPPSQARPSAPGWRRRGEGRRPTTDQRPPTNDADGERSSLVGGRWSVVVRQSSPVEETLTFLFTDIEGSTQWWERYPQKMREALGRHDAIVRGAIE